MLKALPQLVSSVHALFPTISHMAQTPNSRRLSPLFSSWALRPVFLSTSALSYLPTALLTRLVALLTGQSGSGAQTTSTLVASPESVVAALSMAREELARVTDLDEELLETYGDRVWVYWAAEGVDGWVTEDAVREIDAVLERAWGDEGRKRRQRCAEGMPHAFVLNEGESARAFHHAFCRHGPHGTGVRELLLATTIDTLPSPRSARLVPRAQVRGLDRRGPQCGGCRGEGRRGHSSCMSESVGRDAEAFG